MFSLLKSDTFLCWKLIYLDDRLLWKYYCECMRFFLFFFKTGNSIMCCMQHVVYLGTKKPPQKGNERHALSLQHLVIEERKTFMNSITRTWSKEFTTHAQKKHILKIEHSVIQIIYLLTKKSHIVTIGDPNVI